MYIGVSPSADIMKPELSKNTMFLFFGGHATPLQARMVEDWIADPANTEQYFEWLEEWEREHPQYLPDTSKALTQFLLRLESDQAPLERGADMSPAPRRLRWHAYAAAAALIMLASVYLGRNLIQYQYFETGYGEVKSIELPDGSRVSLNANTSLRVPRFGFGTETRDVFLEGEAEFSVVHTANDQKFMVHTPDHLQVEVVGTEFIVYSRHRGSKVVLNRGKVLLRSLADTTKRTMSIKPGDVVTIHNGVFSLKEKQPVQAHVAWKEHRFVFDHTPLEEIAYQVEESFGITMNIPDTLLAKRELTGTYEAEDAEDLLDALSRLLDVEVTRRGKHVEVSERKKF